MSVIKKAILLFIIGTVVCEAAPVQLDERGRLCIDDLTFRIVCAQGKQTFGQGEKYLKAGKLERQAELTTCRSEVYLPEQTPGVLVTSLKSDGSENCEYESVITFTPALKLSGISLRAALPGDAFAGRELIADDKKVAIPIEKDKVSVYKTQCTKLTIPGNDGIITLESTTPFLFLLHDYRPGQNIFSLIIGFEPLSGEIASSSLKLKIKRHPYQSTPLDLRQAVNMGFADEVANDGKGGWSDQGPDNDLRMIPVGKQRWGGLNFNIIDPAKNNGKSCIMLAGKNREYFPNEAGSDIKGNIQGKFLYLIHAMAWPGKGNDIGKVTVTYRDGTSSVLPVRKSDVGNWWSPAPRDNGEVAWVGENSNAYVGLYRSTYALEDKPLKRIDFTSAGTSVWGIVAASVSEQQMPKIQAPPFFVVAGRDWQAIDYRKDIEKGSVFDFSSRLEAPAGKYGPVIVSNGHFAFRDKPEQPVRFYGTNLCSGASYIDKEWAERLADRLAAFGFNVVRTHHHDGGMVNKQLTTELDPAKIDQLDYLIHCFKKRGMYITTDLYISRRLPKGEIPEYPDAIPDIAVYKALVWILDSAFENWKTYSANYLNHVNPYTGFAIKDDPVLVSISLVNEGNINSCWKANAFTSKLYRDKFEQWRKEKKYTSDSSLEENRQFTKFLTEVYNRRYAQMVEFVRAQGVKCPLTDQNMGSSQKLTVMRNQYDYVDTHGYWNHPTFPKKSWQLPALTRHHSALSGKGMARLFTTRIVGKPFAITEFDFASPNRNRAEGPALFGAYGAFQGWDMLCQFAYTHGTEKFMRDDITSGHFDIATDPVKALSQRIGVALFTDGGIKPAEPTLIVPVQDTDDLAFESEYPTEQKMPGLAIGVGSIVGTETPRQNALPGKEFYDPDNGIYRTVTGQIELNSKKETFRVLSPTCETLILPAGMSNAGSFLKVVNKIGRGVFSAISTDQKPLSESDRILILHLTNTLPTKMKFSSTTMECIESYGVTPFLAARGEAELTLSLKNGVNYKLYAVDTAGKRLAEIPMLNGTFKASVFNPFGSVMAYELVKE